MAKKLFRFWIVIFSIVGMGKMENTYAQFTDQICYIGTNNPVKVSAKAQWYVNQAAGTVTIRVTLAKTFVDNTYGTSSIGWSPNRGHTFNDLVQSDQLQIALFDGLGTKKLEFAMDYLTASTAADAPSGYKSLGVLGGDGFMVFGSSANVLDVVTAMDRNFNDFRYVLTTNSPATDTNYTSNSTYPNWIFDVWYEVTVSLSAFGSAGFGYPDMTGVHASPSKTSSATEPVNPTPCNCTPPTATVSSNSPVSCNGTIYLSLVTTGATYQWTGPNGFTSTAKNPVIYNATSSNAGTYTVKVTGTDGCYKTVSTNVSVNCGFTGQVCFIGTTNPSKVSAVAQYYVNLAAGTVTVRTTLAKTFVDNTYGTSAIGWSPNRGHTFSDLVQSDQLQIALYDGTGTKKLEFAMDYLTAATAPDAPSGYKSLGVTGGDGFMVLGSSTSILDVVTSMDRNFNDYRYVLTTNSPATDTNYTPNPTYPNWIFDVWYEVTVSLSAFGSSGFGTVNMTGVHASPSKTSSATEPVTNTPCRTSLGDFVWEDLNGNGIQDPGEPGVRGVTATLYVCGQTSPLATTTTDSTGRYLFRDLAPGRYYVVFSNLPSGYGFTLPLQGGDMALDSDADQFGKTACDSLRSGLDNFTFDAGIIKKASIGNFVWNDYNRNGIQNSGEPGISGVTVTLYKCSDNSMVASMVTDSRGYYLFSNLQPDGYYLVFSNLPSGYVISPKNQGGDGTKDSDADPVTGKTACEILTSGEQNLDYDAGINTCALNIYGCTGQDERGLANTEPVTAVSYSVGITNAGNLIGFPDYDAADAGTYASMAKSTANQVVVDFGSVFTDLMDDSLRIAFASNVQGVSTTIKVEYSADYSTYYLLGQLSTNSQTVVSTPAFAMPSALRFIRISYVSGEVVRLDAPSLEDWDCVSNSFVAADDDYIVSEDIPTVLSVTSNDNNPNGIPLSIVVTRQPSNGYLSINSNNTITYLNVLDFPVGIGTGNGLDTFGYSICNLQGVCSEALVYITVINDDCVSGQHKPLSTTSSTITLQGTSSNMVDAYIRKDQADLNYGNANPVEVGNFKAEKRALFLFNNVAASIPANAVVTSALFSIYRSGGDNVDLNLAVHRLTNSWVEGGVTWRKKDALTSASWLNSGGDFESVPTSTLTSGFSNGYKTFEIGSLVQKWVSGTSPNYGLIVKQYASKLLDKKHQYQSSESSSSSQTPKLVITYATPSGCANIPNRAPLANPEIRNTAPATAVIFHPLSNDADPDGNSITLTSVSMVNPSRGSFVRAGDSVIYTPNLSPVGARVDTLIYTVTDGALTDQSLMVVNISNTAPVLLPDSSSNYAGFQQVVDVSLNDSDAEGNALTDMVVIRYPRHGSFSISGNVITYTPMADYIGNDTIYYQRCEAPTEGCTEIVLCGSTYIIFKMLATACVGDFVWNDNNRNGIQDVGESGRAGIKVKLLTCTGTVLDSTLTGPSGYYYFCDLIPGSYKIQFVLSSGDNFSPKLQGTNTKKDSDADPVTGMTSCFTLAPGQKDSTIDAGIYKKCSLGDFVWDDLDGDGIQDPGEPAITNVRVRLYNCSNTLLDSALTDNNGNYFFTDLIPGSYYVEFVLPSGYFFTKKDQGSDDTKDSDADRVTGKTSCVTLASGENNYTLDAGMYKKACLGDLVWKDINANGVQDAGEQGYEGIKVRLYDCAGNKLDSLLTDANGNYNFCGLAPGGYQVEFVLPSGESFSPQDQGGDDTKDSDVNPSTGKTGCVTLKSGDNNTDTDAGIYKKCSLGDFVWEDTNGNGIQDAGEPAISNVKVRLYNCSNTLLDSTFTNLSGNYDFVDLIPGGYYVQFVLPSGYVFTLKDQGSNDAKDSDPDRSTGKTSCITLNAGDINNTIDAGMYKPACLGDLVWKDVNSNGIQDAGEQGYAGIKVRLYDCSGNVLDSTVTNSSGNYNFCGLAPGGYQVEFVLPSGETFSPQDQGSDDSKDSDANPSTGKTGCITLVSGENNTKTDAGIYKKTSLGDFVWEDTDGDGIQDPGEPGIQNVKVRLYNCSNTLLDSTFTNASGNYYFNNLLPGNYYVQFVLPSGYVFTKKDQGTDDAKDSDADRVTGKTSCVTLNSGETNYTLDGGMYRPACLGDLVWKDADADGIQDPSDQGYAGIKVKLYDCLGNVIDSVLTDANGNYSFCGLAPGGYQVQFILPAGETFSPQDQGSDDTIDSDANPSTGKTGCITLVSGENNTKTDAGIFKKASLGDFVWNDLNADGIQDPGEPGYQGVRVRLYSCTGIVLDSTLTDANGNYLFTGLVPGSYFVEFVLPGGYAFTQQNQGGDDAKDSDANPSNGRTGCVTLVSEEDNRTVDAGIACIAPATPSVSLTQPTCTVATGSITVTAPLGIGFTYSINGVNYQSGTTFSNVAPGSYTVTVKNINNCVSPGTSATINPQPLKPATPTLSTVQPTCTVSTGSITVTSPTGAGFTYSNNSGAFQSGTTFGSLVPGSYSIRVKNADGCISDPAATTINAQPSTPVAPVLTVVQPTCTVSTGSITVSSPTGAGLTYNINGGAFQSGTTFGSLTPGTYSVRVKNSDGCISDPTQGTVNNQPSTPASPTLTAVQPTCTVSTGAITITAPTGTGITYNINNGAYQSGTTFGSLASGVYYVRVKNSDGCISDPAQININPQPSTPAAPVLTTVQPTCSVPTGSVTVTSPLGTGLTYNVNGGAFQSGTTLGGLAPGTYAVRVKNSDGCISDPTQAIIDPQPFTPVTPTLTATQPTCNISTGSITVTSPTGSGVTYNINGGTFQSGTTFSGLSSGTYYVRVKNADGCVSDAAQIIINAPPSTPSAPTLNAVQPSCTVATGSITVTSPTGSGFTYNINGGSFQSGTTFGNLSAGTYNITVKNADGCISSPSQVVINSQPSTPSSPVVSVTQPTCTVGTGSATVTSPTGSGLTYNINGGAYQGSTTFGNLYPGSYSVTVKNSDGCVSAPTSITINPQTGSPSAPTVSTVQPTCSVATGSVTVTSPTGSGFTYSINGGAYQGSTTFGNLYPGSYSVTVKNADGCVSSPTQVTINSQPVAPSAPTFNVTQPSCTVSTGSATVASPVGSGLTYSINGGAYQSSTTFSNLSPGTYNVTVKNADGCVSSSSQFIINTQPVAPSAPTLSLTQPTCTLTTGTITVNSPVGSGLTYSINGGAYQSSTTFSNLSPGTYNVTVKNADGCVSSATQATINTQSGSPSAPTLSVTQPTCSVSTGSITVTSPVGSGLTYNINGGAYQSGTTFSNLTQGTYNVTVKNADGCISSPTQVTINAQPVAPSAPTLSITQPTCTVSTGSITVTSPIGSVTYSINGGSYQSSTTFSNLSPGTYNVTVKSADGCVSSATQVTINTQPVAPSAPTLSVTQPTCTVATGSVTILSPIGSGLTYSINGSSYQSGTVFSNLSPGTYNVTVKSADGCVSSPSQVTVNAQTASPLAPTVSLTQPNCTVPTGSVTVNSPIGSGLTYSINGGSYQSSTTFSNLSPGTYNVTVKNADGCVSSSTQITINTQPGAPAAPTLSVTQPTCTVSTGSITVTSPIGSVTYNLNGGSYQSGTTFSNLSPGTYNVTVKNADGCVSSPTQVTINAQPAAPSAPTLSVTQPTCTVSTGSVTVTSPTGTGLTYNINGGAYQSSTTFSNLSPGTYNITVKNADGCVSGASQITINTQSGSPSAPTLSVTQPTCSVSTGSVTVTSPIGTGLTYSINGGAYQSSTIFSNLSAGTYNITVKSADGCVSPPSQVTINTQPAAPSAPTLSVTQPTCAIATGSVTVISPIGPVTYNINGGTYQSSTTFSNLSPGTYNVTVKSADGCVSSATQVTINTQPSTPSAPTLSVTQSTCTVSTGSVTVVSPIGAGLTYNINGGAYQSSTTFSNLSPGTYNITVKNADGCVSAASQITINTQSGSPVAPTLSVTQPTCSVSTGSVTVTSPVGTGLTYSINGGAYQSSTIFGNLSAGTYNITVKNADGCVSPPTQVTINAQPAPPSAPTLSVTQPTCAVATGSITVISPIGSVTYNINGGTYQSSTIFSNLSPGTYNITVKSADGCVSSATQVTINTQPSTPSAPTLSVTQPTCTVSTGSVTVISPIGTGLTYNINGGAYQSSTTFSNLSPGTYNITVKNADGCVSAASQITINTQSGSPVAPTLSVTQPTCTVATGSITVISPVGTGLTYNINGGAYQSSTSFSNLSAGTYNISVKSADGCVSSPSQVTINIQPATPSAPVLSVTQPSCTVPAGSITVVSPVSSGLTYNINGGAYQVSPTFSNLSIGTYSIRVQSADGCISSPTSVTINAQPSVPAAPTLSVTQPTCTVATGAITVTSPTGTGLTYNINGGAYQSSTTFSNLSPGTYNISVQNADGCVSAPTQVVINVQPVPPSAPVLSVTQPTCTVATGSISVTSPIGTGLTYNINGGAYQSSATFSNLAPGTYSVRVKNADGCVSAASQVTINTQPPTPAAPTLSVTQPTCTVATGSITVTSPTGLLTYNINGGAYQSSTLFSNLNPGTYSVTVKSADGCVSAPAQVVINAQPPTPAAPTLNVTQPTCTVATGSINVTAPTGTGLTYNINGGAYQTSTTFGNLTSGTYSIRVKNADGCVSAPAQVTINAQPPTPTAPTLGATQPTCTVATGSITVTAPTGTGLTYNINGGAYQSSSTFANLTPGIYSVTVKNADGCISAASQVTINAQPPTPSAPTLSVTQPTCTVATGSITVTAPTGTGLTYNINGGAYQSSPAFGNLTPGIYTVTVKNADGCVSAPAQVTINAQPPTPAAPTLSVTQPTCTVATGSITVTAPTGTGLTYNINGGSYQSSTTFSNLSPGTYSIRVKNADGCVSAASQVTVNAQPPTPAAPTLSVTQPTCTVATGSITVISPTGLLTYNINGGAYQSSTLFSNLNPGTYSVTVKNADGCVSAPAQVTINTQPPTPAAPTLSVTQPTCTVATGSINVTAPIGTGLTYNINGGAYQTSTTFGNLTPGTYSIRVKNADGCVSSPAQVTINAQPPTPAAPTLSVTQPTCTVATGSITVSAPTGAGLTYNINGGAYQSSSTFGNLTPGIYSVTVKNADGCVSAPAQVTINAQPPTPAAPTLSVTQPTCTVATGSITVTAPTGTGLTYNINGGAYQSSSTFSNLAPGTYSVRVKNADGCISDPAQVTINTQPPTPAAPTLSVTQPTCTVATGSVTVTAPTGTGLTYNINGGAYQTSVTFGNLTPGTYSVRVKNADGCVSAASQVTVNSQPPTPAAPTLSVTQPTCTVATGSITVTAPTGTGLTYNIDGGAYQASATFGNLTPGTYSITVKNASGCVSAPAQVTINAQPPTPAAPTLSVTQPTCTVATGSITVTAPLGTGLTYNLNGGTYQSNPAFSNLSPGTYSIRVKNAEGCISDPAQVTINAQLPTPVAPSVSVTQPTCTVATGSITVTSPVGSGLTYNIDGGIFQGSASFSNLPPGTYSVRVKNADGCVSAATQVTINAQPPTPAAPTVSVTQPTCTVATGSITVTAPLGNGLSYNIDGGGFRGSTTFNNLDPGTYLIRVRNADGCISDSTPVIINAQPPTPAAPTLSVTQPTCTVATGSITVTAPAGTGYTYNIDGGIFQSSPTFSNLTPGNYRIRVKNADGCVSDPTQVTVNSQPPTPVAPTLSVTQPGCTVATGSVTVTSPTGQGLTYNIDGGIFQSSTTFSNLSPGTYSIRVKNADGCISDSTQFTINIQPPTPSAPILNVIQPTCTVATGTITVTSPTGTGLTYNINGGTYQSGLTFGNLAPGTYSVRVKNADGCVSDPAQVIINAQPPTPAAPAVSVTQPTCTVATGSITVTAPVGTGLTYNIDGGVFQGNATFSSLSPGTYSIRVKNADGCVSAATQVIINAQPTTPAAPTLTATQPTCTVATGSVTVTSPVGSGLTYNIDGGSYQNSATFSNLSPGTYSIRVKNADGCVSPATQVTINAQPPTPDAPTINVTQPTCTVATGTITVTAPSGAGLTYNLNGGIFQSSAVFSNLSPGTYSIRVKNADGCVSAATQVTVNNQPPNPAAPTLIVTQPTCTLATGTISVTAPTGAGLTYNINGGSYQSGTSFTNLNPGTYSITVKNADGCVSSASQATINAQPSTPAAPTLSLTQPTCTVATGTINVTSPLGTGLTYNINGGAYQSSASFSNLSPGTYSVRVKNADGCISPATQVTINTQPPTPAAPTISVTQPTCTVATGTITVTSPSGTGFTYNINGGTYQSDGTFSNLSPGIYSIRVKNADGCVSAATQATINTQPASPSAPTLSLTQPNCTVATGSITVTAPTGAGLSYNINGGAFQGGTTFSNLAPGIYTIRVKNADGCISAGTTDTITTAVCNTYCTYTMGYYGSTNGNSCDGVNTYNSATDLIRMALGLTAVPASPNPIIIGTYPAGNSITIPATDAAAIKLNAVMPGGSTPTQLLNIGNCVITAQCFNQYLSLTGKIRNVLLSQTIALTLNARLNNSILASMPIRSGWLTTQKRNGCGTQATAVLCNADRSSISSFKLNDNVVNYLTNNGANAATVQDLLNLANLVLGGTVRPGSAGPNGLVIPSYSDVNSAINSINVGFDECKIFLGYFSCQQTCSSYGQPCDTSTAGRTISVTTYPNPYREQVNFVISTPFAGNATLRIYNSLGQLLSVLVDGYLPAGATRTITYNSHISTGSLFYIFEQNGRKFTGKLIRQ